MDEIVRLARAIALSLLVLLPRASQAAPQPPSIAFGDLYRAVEMSGMFPDQKSFADVIPDAPPEAIMAEYDKAKRQSGFDLRKFVAAHFKPAPRAVLPLRRQAGQSVSRYIAGMWNVLERKPDPPPDASSLLPLHHSYIVPGGRFGEIYYWDSYFSMLGLIDDGRRDLARDMLANIADLIREYGHMPNGNRSYYLSRSQPPFFSAMVGLIAAKDGAKVYRAYLPELRAEYDYWMAGADALKPGTAFRRVVRLKDGTLLNRYWDDRAAPRDESYAQDVETARETGRPAGETYRQLRATSESGWDFSSRWLGDGIHLATLHTTDFAPVDLNVLMQHLEMVLARAYQMEGDADNAELFAGKAQAREAAIRRLMWNKEVGFFTDYLWRDERQSATLTLAAMFPLYFHLATQEQVKGIAALLQQKFLMPGGLAPTLTNTGQQWDKPNGWAPLEYVAIEGLKNYGETALAAEIAKRWMEENIGSFAASGLLLEKYNVAQLPKPGQASPGGGGEYALQVGFGWTNGVLAKLMAEYPRAARAASAKYLVH